MLGCYEVDIVLNLFQIKIIPSPSGLSCYLLSPSTIQLSMQVNIHKYSLIDSFLAYEQKGLRADTLSAAKHYAVVARWGAVAGQWERRRVAPEPERQCFRRRRRPRWLC
nr:uncharacterized protein LOC4328950 isoform X1 [Oryza sativa Japonica Group]